MVIKEKGLENHYPKFGSKVFFKNLQNPSSKSHKWWKMGQIRVLSKITVTVFKILFAIADSLLRDREGQSKPSSRSRHYFANAMYWSLTLRERDKAAAIAKANYVAFRDREATFANA